MALIHDEAELGAWIESTGVLNLAWQSSSCKAVLIGSLGRQQGHKPCYTGSTRRRLELVRVPHPLRPALGEQRHHRDHGDLHPRLRAAGTERGSTTDSFFQVDWLGSTRYVTDSTEQQTLAAQNYDAWGNRVAGTGVWHPTDLQWAGGWGYQREYSNGPAEPGLGLYYVQQRYYEPSTGRFFSQDRWGWLPDAMSTRMRAIRSYGERAVRRVLRSPIPAPARKER
jgi:RHS repeat-associated protein